jgi:osmotically-inducible protein OsmY
MKLFTLFLGVALASHATADTVGQTIRDARITGRVESAFLFSEHLSPFNINTTTSGGVVTLSGGVRDQVQKDLAGEIAESVDGVMEVLNGIIVVPMAPERVRTRDWRMKIKDKSTSASVRTRFLYHKQFKGLRIKVRTVNGVVTLSGVVSSEDRRKRIGNIAYQTKGVERVENRLSVRPKDPTDQVQNVGRQFSDEWVEKRVETAIALNRHLSIRRVDVEVDDGVCILTGGVNTEPEKMLAGSIADSIQGVRTVRNDIHIRSDMLGQPQALEMIEPVEPGIASAPASEVSARPLEPIEEP